MAVQPTTFVVKLSPHLWLVDLLHLWSKVIIFMVSITFMVGITFMVPITVVGDTVAT